MENLNTHLKWKLREWKSGIRNKRNAYVKTNYKNPKLTWREEILCLIEGTGIVLLFSYFFYRSYWAVLLMSPGIWFYRNYKKKKLWKKRKEIIEVEFKEALMAIQTNLQSGYSIENAFVESYTYIVSIFGDSCDMAKELMWIKIGLRNKDTLEHLLEDLGKRCPQSALEDFSNIFLVISKTGGDWNEIITKIAGNISQRIELQEEINVVIHGRKMESRMMCIIPLFILFYMDTTSKGYFDVMYHNVLGIAIMTVCMVAYVIAFLIAQRVTMIV